MASFLFFTTVGTMMEELKTTLAMLAAAEEYEALSARLDVLERAFGALLERTAALEAEYEEV